MPFGSRQNNFLVTFMAIFLGLSVASSIVGQVLFNTRNLKSVVAQNRELMDQHREMLLILRGLEHRYLTGREAAR